MYKHRSAPNHTHKRRPYNDLGSYDFLICGGGIVGLTIARELLNKGGENIVVIEKEDDLGKHASGRNSGVLHAGIYYSSNSLKAKFCLKGNFLLRQYCKEKELPLFESGKVIVAKSEDEIGTLMELYKRAVENGAKVELVNEKQLNEIEPNAKTYEIALYSHYTAVIDPNAVLKSLYEDLTVSRKVKVITGMEFKRIQGDTIALTNKGEIRFKTFINAAGGYSDRVANAFGLGLNFKTVPFKGLYRKVKSGRSHLVKGNIYPVPDISNPFLGVHFTKDINGEIYIGPTAIPALGRENYGIFDGIGLEALDILIRDTVLFLVNSGFRDVALTEPRKYFSKYFFNNAKKLVKELNPEDIMASNKVGIRPQLVDWNKKELVMDFVVIKGSNSIHILNAISPAFTCSMAFADFVVKEYIH